MAEPPGRAERAGGAEARLARRIAYERAARGWTFESFAQRVTDAGCPLNATAAYRIEKGRPPRRINVNEFLAIAHVLGLTPTALLVPPEIAEVRATAHLVDQLFELEAEIAALTVRRDELRSEVLRITAASPEARAALDDLITERIQAAWPGEPT